VAGRLTDHFQSPVHISHLIGRASGFETALPLNKETVLLSQRFSLCPDSPFLSQHEGIDTPIRRQDVSRYALALRTKEQGNTRR
jgi:hypothetical protein